MSENDTKIPMIDIILVVLRFPDVAINMTYATTS